MDLYRWLLRKHIEPHLGGVLVGKLTTRMVREWRAQLLANGVSVSVAAKAYQPLRAVLMTAVEDDKILPRNPCRVRGAGSEDAGERPVLTVAQASSWPGWSVADRSATSGSCRVAATGSVSPGTARCVRHRRSTEPGKRRNVRCGGWAATAGLTSAMIGGSTPGPPSPLSGACAGERRQHCGAAILTWERGRSECARPTSSDRPGKCCSGHRSQRPDGGSSASRRRSFQLSKSTCRSSRRMSRAPSSFRVRRAAHTPGKLQQAFGLAAGGGIDRHAGPALPRLARHRQPPRGQERGRTEGPMANMVTTASGPP